MRLNKVADWLGIVHCRSIAGRGLRPPGTRETACAPAFQQQECCPIVETAREFIDYWIENCVHASEPHGAVGAEQDVSILIARCVEMASTLGFSKAALDRDVGSLSAYIGAKLAAVNRFERERRV